MPSIYLSPSTQEYNPYITGGTEEQYMNELADALEPYLLSNGIRFIRNKPEMTAASSIAASNAGEYDLHLALHSNAAPGAQAGTVRGSQAYYYPGSSRGERAAQHFAEQLKRIYPLPENVQAIPTTTIGEVRRTRAPAVLLEVAYHDNPEDAAWITANISEIARALAQALTQYFGLPFREAAVPRDGVVTLTSGYLNIRDNPSPQGTVIARAYNGAPLTIWGRAGETMPSCSSGPLWDLPNLSLSLFFLNLHRNTKQDKKNVTLPWFWLRECCGKRTCFVFAGRRKAEPKSEEKVAHTGA